MLTDLRCKHITRKTGQWRRCWLLRLGDKAILEDHCFAFFIDLAAIILSAGVPHTISLSPAHTTATINRHLPHTPGNQECTIPQPGHPV